MESQNTTQNKPGQLTLAVREQQEDEIDLVELFYLLWGHMLQIMPAGHSQILCKVQ